MKETDRVYGELKKKFESGFWGPGERLPTILELARMARVSRGTLAKVLARFKQEGLASFKRGSAIIAGSADAEIRLPKNSGLAWKRLKEQVGRDILSANLSDSTLYPLSKTARRYDVALGTLKKALDGLVGEGMVSKQGLRFRLTPKSTRQRMSAVALIASGDSEKGISIGDPRTTHVVESFERESLRLGFRSRGLGFNCSDSRSLIRILREFKPAGDISGCIINLWKTTSADEWKRWLDLLHALTDRRIPCIVLDQDGSIGLEADLLRGPYLRMLRIAGARAGAAIGQLLIKAKHQRIAFLMPVSRHEWAQRRFEGLREYCQRYGDSAADVELHALDEIQDIHDLNLAIMGISPKQVSALYGRRLTREEVQGFIERINNERIQRFRSQISKNEKTHSVQALARFMARFSTQNPDPWLFDSALSNLEHVASALAAEQFLHPLLETVFAKSRATAWVCPEDMTAIHVASFLRSKAKRVPEDISVVGFENWREAYEQQLTTYDFNVDGMVKEALLMIMDEKTFRNYKSITEFDGYVVERRTTKR